MGEKYILGDMHAASYLEAALSNTSSPHPVCIGIADEVIAYFMTDWECSNRVSALKMFALAWGSLRSATLISRMGMVLQAPPIQRQALEAIVYGILFCADSEFHELWKNRHDDVRAMSRFRREGWKRGLTVVGERDKKLRSAIERVYQALVDLGAHPNVLGIQQMSDYEIGIDKDFGRAVYSQLMGQPYVDLAHINTMCVYNALIDAIILVWPERAGQIFLAEKARRAHASMIDFIRFVRDEGSSSLA